MAAPRRSLRVAGLAVGADVLLSACITVGAPTPRVDCVGLPPGRCPGAALDAERNAVPGGPAIVSIRIRAVNPPCTDSLGMGTTVFTHEDGRRETEHWSYLDGGTVPSP